MPKFVGNHISGSTSITPNAKENLARVRLTYSQACLLPVASVMRSLDTTDRGGPRSLAKRWYRWFASPEAIFACPLSTPNMHARALLVIKPGWFAEVSTRRIRHACDHDDCRASVDLMIACLDARN